MSWYIYSTEAMPNPELIGKTGYTPDNDYIKFGGAMLPCLPKGQWVKLPDSFTTVRHTDWKDKQGTETEVGIRKFKPIVDSPDRGFAERGVIMVDHEPVDAEKKKLEHLSAELNLKFRKKHVEFYENQRQVAMAKQGTYPVNPYTDECYEVLGMNKPYSVDALQALRDPGARAAQQIADAISDGQKANATAIAEAVQEALTRPTKAEKPVEGKGGSPSR